MTGDGTRALYQRIADDIRRQIDSGELGEGARVPSESVIATNWSTTRITARQALEALRVEGLIVRQHGRGSFVRTRPALRTRSSTRYTRSPGETSPFARDAQREGTTPAWTHETDRIRATEDVAARLGIEAGAHVMRTRYRYTADERPIQLSVSWEPFGVVGGTAIEEPEEGDGPRGVVARFDSIGIRIDRVVERIEARAAAEGERRQLDMPDGMWVQRIARTHYAGELAVETADITVPADRYQLEYVIEVK
ncbi:GntR family transcriptional regulator [Frankia sp. AgB1.9]|uniref:GntR family transcriptional regulator n=1 Tax=unclassified Frankia TaxID=2632575 RepID=UPI001933FE38|nr:MULTISPECIES: GntR family transcriptional regulator [unclassified Frankia]MBL7487350.1 GntR family transcriptional regulator [Frankia sp. AgW1.1]MBL7546358.1 GntR family transcriptional regulator [Frankia sp. AgB1.9]MBL7618597.1 GntR family transcriptional regulator [Frankia sp. AgB1.8]